MNVKDKNSILYYFDEEDRAEVLNLYEKYELAWNKDIPLFGNNFYSPKIWKYFQEKLATKDFRIDSNGIFEEAERRMIAFNNVYDSPFPMEVLKIVNLSKFKKLSHKDYLGSILALGIRRNKIGDLLVCEEECYVVVCEEIKDFIISNLTVVGRCPCRVELVNEETTLPKINFKEEVILIQSNRIDSIVSKLAKVSRNTAQSMIEEGKVLIDYNRVQGKSEEVSKGQRITIRGVGKFILGEFVGNSKKGKIKVIVKKYT